MEQYISKSAVVAEIERRIKVSQDYAECNLTESTRIGNQAQLLELNDILSFLDTLEVKEVDFERELSKYVSNGIHRFFPNVDDDYCKMESFIWQDYVIETAKYFYELGLHSK